MSDTFIVEAIAQSASAYCCRRLRRPPPPLQSSLYPQCRRRPHCSGDPASARKPRSPTPRQSALGVPRRRGAPRRPQFLRRSSKSPDPGKNPARPGSFEIAIIPTPSCRCPAPPARSDFVLFCSPSNRILIIRLFIPRPICTQRLYAAEFPPIAQDEWAIQKVNHSTGVLR